MGNGDPTGLKVWDPDTIDPDDVFNKYRSTH